MSYDVVHKKKHVHMTRKRRGLCVASLPRWAWLLARRRALVIVAQAMSAHAIIDVQRSQIHTHVASCSCWVDAWNRMLER